MPTTTTKKKSKEQAKDETKTNEEISKSDIEDCQCPICLEILIEPVTMPCKHELCLICFQKHIEETSLTCPMCRLRISNWSRKAHREKTLVNNDRWAQIQKLFPKEVRRRIGSPYSRRSTKVG